MLAGRPTERYAATWWTRSRKAVEVSVHFSPIRGAGERIVGASAVVIDNTRGTAALASIARSTRQLRRGFDNSPIGMALVEPNGTFVEVNDALCRLLGYPRERLLATTFQVLTAAEDLPEELRYVEQMLSGSTHGYHLEKRFLSADRGPVWVLLSCSSVNTNRPEPDFLLLQMEDITARKAAEGFLMHRALHDPLTDLPNRILLLDRIAQALAGMERREALVAALYIDADGFKEVNDTMGHEVGDQVLIAIAERLRGVCRPSDTVARLGGDEFVMLCDGVQRSDEVLAIAERVRAALGSGLLPGEGVASPTVSLGVAIADSETTSPLMLLDHADTALYQAKAVGGNCVRLFDGRAHLRTPGRVALADELRHAIQADELRLAYQVVVDLTTGRVDAVEALVRWQHPRRGLLPPGQFLPVAEQSGLIVALGSWVLHEACQQAARWNPPGAPPVTICVNVSALELARPEFVGEVAAALAQAQLAADRLCLEITEGTLLAGDRARETCTALAALGVQLAIDNYGSGFSSLSALQQFHLSWIKIDPKFVQGLGPDGGDGAVVDASVRMAGSLHLGAVGEGVEDQQQAIDLRSLGCQRAQGFYFEEPQSAEATTSLLSTGFAEVTTF